MPSSTLASTTSGIGWALGQDGYLALTLTAQSPSGGMGWARRRSTRPSAAYTWSSAYQPGRRIGNGVSKFPTQGWGEVRDGGYMSSGGPPPRFDVAELGHIARPAPGVADRRRRWRPTQCRPTELGGVQGRSTQPGAWGASRGLRRRLAAPGVGASRHDHAVEVACWLAREAAAGLVPAREAFGVLEELVAEAKTAKEDDTAGRQKTRKLTWRDVAEYRVLGARATDAGARRGGQA